MNICLKYPVHFTNMGSWARCLGGLIFSWSRGNCLFFFQFFSIYILDSIYLTFVPWFWSKDLVYGYFFPLKESCILFQIWIFSLKLPYILSLFLLAELWKCTPTVLMEHCDHAICLGLSILLLYAGLQKFIFKLEAFWDNSEINCFLVRQLKSLKKMVVSSAKFTILISWSPICMLLILVSASMKIASSSATIMHNNKSGQPWWNIGWE